MVLYTFLLQNGPSETNAALEFAVNSLEVSKLNCQPIWIKACSSLLPVNRNYDITSFMQSTGDGQDFLFLVGRWWRELKAYNQFDTSVNKQIGKTTLDSGAVVWLNKKLIL